MTRRKTIITRCKQSCLATRFSLGAWGLIVSGPTDGVFLGDSFRPELDFSSSSSSPGSSQPPSLLFLPADETAFVYLVTLPSFSQNRNRLIRQRSAPTFRATRALDQPFLSSTTKLIRMSPPGPSFGSATALLGSATQRDRGSKGSSNSTSPGSLRRTLSLRSSSRSSWSCASYGSGGGAEKRQSLMLISDLDHHKVARDDHGRRALSLIDGTWTGSKAGLDASLVASGPSSPLSSPPIDTAFQFHSSALARLVDPKDSRGTKQPPSQQGAQSSSPDRDQNQGETQLDCSLTIPPASLPSSQTNTSCCEPTPNLALTPSPTTCMSDLLILTPHDYPRRDKKDATNFASYISLEDGHRRPSADPSLGGPLDSTPSTTRPLLPSKGLLSSTPRGFVPQASQAAPADPPSGYANQSLSDPSEPIVSVAPSGGMSFGKRLEQGGDGPNDQQGEPKTSILFIDPPPSFRPLVVS